MSSHLKGGGVTIMAYSLKKIFCQNSLYRGKIMRKIDCAHSRSVKMLPWPWFREIDVYWSENRKILKFLPQNHISGGNFMRGIDCAHSRSLKTLSWTNSGKLVHVGFSLQYTLLFSWIRIKEAFSRFGNARNRFPAWNYPPEIWFWGKNFKIFW